jgi:hypothetical protein
MRDRRKAPAVDPNEADRGPRSVAGNQPVEIRPGFDDRRESTDRVAVRDPEQEGRTR